MRQRNADRLRHTQTECGWCQGSLSQKMADRTVIAVVRQHGRLWRLVLVRLAACDRPSNRVVVMGMRRMRVTPVRMAVCMTVGRSHEVGMQATGGTCSGMCVATAVMVRMRVKTRTHNQSRQIPCQAECGDDSAGSLAGQREHLHDGKGNMSSGGRRIGYGTY